MTKQELFDKADYYKSLINNNRPFDLEQLNEIDNYFRVGFTYSSNSIERNTLTITETKILVSCIVEIVIATSLIQSAVYN